MKVIKVQYFWIMAGRQDCTRNDEEMQNDISGLRWRGRGIAENKLIIEQETDFLQASWNAKCFILAQISTCMCI